MVVLNAVPIICILPYVALRKKETEVHVLQNFTLVQLIRNNNIFTQNFTNSKFSQTIKSLVSCMTVKSYNLNLSVCKKSMFFSGTMLTPHSRHIVGGKTD